MSMRLPELALVALVGPSGSGKSTFARRHFKPTEVLSSDFFRGLVSDDENDQAATGDAFDALFYVAGKRLAARRLVVVDATNVRAEDRRRLVALAREHHVLPVAIVLDLPEKVCTARNAERSDRSFGARVVRQQRSSLHRGLRGLKREGFRHVNVLRSADEVEAVEIVRERLWTDRRDEHGPFDVIGDIHGCFDELRALLAELGWSVRQEGDGTFKAAHPDDRRLVFLGDLVDRGPKIPEVLHLVMDLVADGTAFCVQGNHEAKLLRKLRGKQVRLTHGLEASVDQLEGKPEAFVDRVREFLFDLRSHYLLDDGRLVVAHAGLPEALQGRASGAVRAFALYGETTGETDEFGLPVRYQWARDYRGRATVVYGHTPVPEPEWLNGTVCVDTGCVFGGRLTALRWPEQETVSVPALKTWVEPARPLAPASGGLSAQQLDDDLLDMEDVRGKRIISTRLYKQVTIRETHAAPALEVLARFAANPKWLVHLPPTMSPPATSERPGLLEHPDEAFAYFRSRGVERVVCEEKHMGSRAVVVLCRNAEVARERFGVDTGEDGIVHTRTGRRFFPDRGLERALLDRLRAAMDESGFWSRLKTDWAVLDCELMPWSTKAQALIDAQYAPVGAAAHAFGTAAGTLLAAAAGRGLPVAPLAERAASRLAGADAYADAYRHYCWPVAGLDDLRLAPFHVLATEGRVHSDRDHLWHMGTLAEVCAADPKLLLATPHRAVRLDDEAEVDAAVAWWTNLTDAGGEGMVVKPFDYLARGPKGLVQPAVKVRGHEYLRIIYGPTYTEPDNLARLRQRSLGRKRGLALRELSLGLEGLERFVAREPLRRVHECVFGVLALESEAVDPRL